MGLAEKILEDKPKEITKFSNTHDTNLKKRLLAYKIHWDIVSFYPTHEFLTFNI